MSVVSIFQEENIFEIVEQIHQNLMDIMNSHPNEPLVCDFFERRESGTYDRFLFSLFAASDIFICHEEQFLLEDIAIALDLLLGSLTDKREVLLNSKAIIFHDDVPHWFASALLLQDQYVERALGNPPFLPVPFGCSRYPAIRKRMFGLGGNPFTWSFTRVGDLKQDLHSWADSFLFLPSSIYGKITLDGTIQIGPYCVFDSEFEIVEECRDPPPPWLKFDSMPHLEISRTALGDIIFQYDVNDPPPFVLRIDFYWFFGIPFDRSFCEKLASHQDYGNALEKRHFDQIEKVIDAISHLPDSLRFVVDPAQILRESGLRGFVNFYQHCVSICRPNNSWPRNSDLEDAIVFPHDHHWLLGCFGVDDEEPVGTTGGFDGIERPLDFNAYYEANFTFNSESQQPEIYLEFNNPDDKSDIDWSDADWSDFE